MINSSNTKGIVEIKDHIHFSSHLAYYRNETDESIVITNNGEEVIVEKTTIDGNGEQQTTREAFPIIKTDMHDSLSQNRIIYGAWQYTGFAVGRQFFAALAGLGISKITAGIAATFSISSAGASFLVGYMGIKAGMNAASLAKALDSNGNGYIALYKRHLRNYKNGPSIGTQHRTY
ncbi:hypothetical protein [Enterococcus hulanensis]|uniref:hypothetical protein n=1 Tax=Enterococcus hulanensis TaxID=2559929 RepID=UPI0020172CAF|nr:hypothetical protein [Enterococcus hulanensis]